MKEKIYFIPGLMTDERIWCKVFPFLTKYETININIPYSSNFDEINKILLKKLQNEEKINLVGFSLGGYITSFFAIEYGHKINKLFIASSTASCTQKEEEIKRKGYLKTLSSATLKLSFKKALSLLEEKNRNDEKLIKIIIDMFDSLGKDIFIKQIKLSLKRKNIYTNFNTINFPVWFFYSLNDRLLDTNAIIELEKIKNIHKICIKGTSHLLPLEHPNEFVENIKIWMEL